MNLSKKTLERLIIGAAAPLLVVAVLACKGGGPGAQATVVCTGEKDAVSCQVTHVAGNRPIEACWDLSYDCANGTLVKGHDFCQTVQPSSTAEKRIALTELGNFEKCDKAMASKVENLRLTPK